MKNFKITNNSGIKPLALIPFKYAKHISQGEMIILNYIFLRNGLPNFKINHTDISINTGLKLRTVENHIKALKDRGIINIKRVGKTDYFYNIILPNVNELLEGFMTRKKQHIIKIYDPQILGVMTRKFCNHDPQILVTMTRKKQGVYINILDLFNSINHLNLLKKRIKSLNRKKNKTVDKLQLHDCLKDKKDNKEMEFNLSEIVNFLESETKLKKIENLPPKNLNEGKQTFEEKKEEINVPDSESDKKNEVDYSKKSNEGKKDYSGGRFFPEDYFSGIDLKLFHELNNKEFGFPATRNNDIKVFILKYITGKPDSQEKLRQVIEIAKLKNLSGAFIRKEFFNDKFQMVYEGSNQSAKELSNKELNEKTKQVNRLLSLPVGDFLQTETFKYLWDKVDFYTRYNADRSMGKEKFFNAEMQKINDRYEQLSLPENFREQSKKIAIKNLNNNMAGIDLELRSISEKVLNSISINDLKMILKYGCEKSKDFTGNYDKVNGIISTLVNFDSTANSKPESLQNEKIINISDKKAKGLTMIGDLLQKYT